MATQQALNQSFSTEIMTIKSLIVCGSISMCVSVCLSQVPAKKTELTLADREAWRNVLRWPDELEQQWQKSRTDKASEQSGLSFYNLGEKNYLVAIEVHESAYQPRYVFMRYSESDWPKPARLLKIKTYERDDDTQVVTSKLMYEVEGIATFDAAKKQLVFYTKGRGTGDCGSLVRYVISRTQAVPVEARVHACYDDYSLGVTDPLRWRKIKRL